MLAKNRRLSRAVDWQKIHRYGRGVHLPEIVLKYVKNNQTITRFGFIVGAKVSKKANQRNLIKRRLRAIIQQIKPAVKAGYDLAFIVKPPLAAKNYAAIREIVDFVIKKSRLYND